MIRIEGVTKSFGTKDVLRGIDLHIPEGETVALFGPNGAGKTTLLKILATVMKASSGKITIGGYPLPERPEKIRRLIGFMAHQTFLYDNLTAEENLKFYGKIFDVPDLKVKIKEALEKVGLQHQAFNSVGTFSRGMQQRLSIARVLLHEPQVLLLDEPYTGLDQHATELFQHLLQTFRQEGRTIILVTHELEKGLNLAQRAVILNNGRILSDQNVEPQNHQNFKETYYRLVKS
ncbi:MAG: heme ABC exporter ATP-binding protein CcmA [candidate division KSB1 bacterium]|nr:heme ABC exporter ATP-binding protein CcmA [candidate division KSB1 bacterium]